MGSKKGEEPAGVFFLKGMPIRVSNLRLIEDDSGEVQLDPIVLQLQYDVVPTWLHLAFQHLIESEMRCEEVQRIWQDPDEEAKVKALEAEFQAAMQACIASAIALDAFYACVKDTAGVPSSSARSRHAKIADTLGTAFRYRNEVAKKVSRVLGEIFSVRNLAVHPGANFKEPQFRPDLNVGVPWHFAQFRFELAKRAVHASLSIVAHLVSRSTTESKALADYCQRTQRKVRPIVERWESKYDPLYFPG